MRTLFVLLKKEWMELIRSGRFLILILIFVLFGIMNPAIAKITPWLMETMAGSLEGTGLIVTEVQVDAMTSWTQFFKNIPMGLIIFVLMYSGIFAKEYQSGTLVMVLTKGVSRAKVLLAKWMNILLMWTGCYWLCYGITYIYNAYFWDNCIAENLPVAAVFWWLFGIWTTQFIIFFSTITKTNTGVLAGTGVAVLVSYLLGLFAEVYSYVPTKLMNSVVLLIGAEEPDSYFKSIFITIFMVLLCLGGSIPILNRKQI